VTAAAAAARPANRQIRKNTRRVYQPAAAHVQRASGPGHIQPLARPFFCSFGERSFPGSLCMDDEKLDGGLREAKRPRKTSTSELASSAPAAAGVSVAAPASEARVAVATLLSGGTCLLRNLPKHLTARGLEALLKARGVAFSEGSVKKRSGSTVGFVIFGRLSDRIAAIESFDAFAAANPEAARVTVETAVRGAAGAAPGKPETADDAVAEAHARATRDVRDAVTPLWRTPYAAQLVSKRATVSAALCTLTKGVACASGAHPPAWLPPEGEACPLHGIVASPVLLGYRNKCELTIGPNAEGDATVGFNVGLFRDGFACVAAPDLCANVSAACRALAGWTQQFLREHSMLPCWDKRSGAGFWRLLLVREGGTAQVRRPDWHNLLRLPDTPSPTTAADTAAESEAAAVPLAWQGGPPLGDAAVVLAMLQVSPDGHDPATVRAECVALAAHLRAHAAAASPPLPLSQLLVQLHGGFSNAAPESSPVTRLEDGEQADACITERMCGLAFRVSPASFFQTNTAAAEALYDIAGDWAAEGGVGAEGTLFDVCCGTGTIGLTLASRFRSVVGVDICAAAVRDAWANAALNGVAHARFVAGKAESALPPLLAEAQAQGQTAIAIVDPPRQGLHRTVLSALRKCTLLRRLVYVSCNVQSLAENAVQLCSPAGPGLPFRPVKCLAVDLFPHTSHVEAVLLLER